MGSQIVEAIVGKAGSLRKAAKAINYNPAYLSRVRHGEEPSLNFLRAVGRAYPDLWPMIQQHIESQ